MFKFKIAIACLALGTCAALAAPIKSDVITLSAMEDIPTGDVQSRFIRLSSAAREKGMGQVMIWGEFTGKKAGSGKDYSVLWKELQLVHSGRVLATPFGRPLHSQFSGPSVIDAETEMKISGDSALIALAYGRLLDMVAEEGDDTLTSLAVVENNQGSKGSDKSPTLGGNQSGGKPEKGDGAFDFSDLYSAGDKSEVRTIPCEDRIDIPGRTVYGQSRQEIIGRDGEIEDAGTCSDNDQVMPIYPHFDQMCGYEDGGDGFAYQSFIPVYNKNGGEITVSSDCWAGNNVDTPDLKWEIRHLGCGYFDDYAQGKSIRMVNDVVDINGVALSLLACHQTEESAPIKEEHCRIVEIDGKRYSETREFAQFKGGVNLIRDCSVQADSELFATACSAGDRYDIVSSTKYAYLREFLINITGDTVQGCMTNRNISYDIKTEKHGCSTKHDDENRLLTWRGKRYFLGLGGQRINIDDECVDIGTIAYENGVQEWSMTQDEWISIDARLLRVIPSSKTLGSYFKEAWASLDKEAGGTVYGYQDYPDDWNFEWFLKRSDVEPIVRPIDNVRLGCFYLQGGAVMKDFDVESLSTKEKKKKWYCKITGAEAGWANLADWSLMQTQPRGDGTDYVSCSMSNRFTNVLGGIAPDTTEITNDFGDCPTAE